MEADKQSNNIAAVTGDSVQRILIPIIERYGCNYKEAVQLLQSMSLNIICNENIFTSPSLQAALLTMVNTACRSFWGGVQVQMPANVPNLLSCENSITLNNTIHKLGGNFNSIKEKSKTLFLGMEPLWEINSAEVVCNGWQGGVVVPGERVALSKTFDFSLGGTFAGAFSVALAFLSASEIYTPAMDKTAGLSLWRPDLPWLDKDSEGPKLNRFPKRLWLLGLGHLGQAYLWNLGLLPIQDRSKINIMLQDYDTVNEANLSAGLLTTRNDIGKRKARICSSWLEQLGFATTICERPFDASTRRTEEEPYIALCGFDSATARQLIEGAGFHLIIESGIGGTLADFDRIACHIFPNNKFTASDYWNVGYGKIVHQHVENAFGGKGVCGAVVLSEKAISTSFVGALTGSIIISELLRGLHGGVKIIDGKLSIRNLDFNFTSQGKYHIEHAVNGSVE